MAVPKVCSFSGGQTRAAVGRLPRDGSRIAAVGLPVVEVRAVEEHRGALRRLGAQARRKARDLGHLEGRLLAAPFAGALEALALEFTAPSPLVEAQPTAFDLRLDHGVGGATLVEHRQDVDLVGALSARDDLGHDGARLPLHRLRPLALPIAQKGIRLLPRLRSNSRDGQRQRQCEYSGHHLRLLLRFRATGRHHICRITALSVNGLRPSALNQEGARHQVPALAPAAHDSRGKPRG